MRRLGTFIFGATLFIVAVGCNSILENEPGRLDRGASAGGGTSATSDDGNGAEPISGGEPDAGGASVSTDGTGTSGGNTGATPDSGACSVGQKACGGLCVSVDDPFFGCATPGCARCETPNATAACMAGACGVGACVAGFGDCNALPADGCETNLQTMTDCGGCGLKCPELKNAQMACVAGVCTGTCEAGFGDCNLKPEDGCEKNLLKDKNNCGACGNHCVFGRCEGGVCVWND